MHCRQYLDKVNNAVEWETVVRDVFVDSKSQSAWKKSGETETGQSTTLDNLCAYSWKAVDENLLVRSCTWSSLIST